MMNSSAAQRYETLLAWRVIMDCRVKPGNDSGEDRICFAACRVG
jgi:hypothetical protein